MLALGYDEAGNPYDAEVEIVDRVSFLVEVSIFCAEARSHLGGDPRQDFALANPLEKIELLEGGLMHFHADVHSEVDWQLVYEGVQARHV